MDGIVDGDNSDTDILDLSKMQDLDHDLDCVNTSLDRLSVCSNTSSRLTDHSCLPKRPEENSDDLLHELPPESMGISHQYQNASENTFSKENVENDANKMKINQEIIGWKERTGSFRQMLEARRQKSMMLEKTEICSINQNTPESSVVMKDTDSTIIQSSSPANTANLSTPSKLPISTSFNLPKTQPSLPNINILNDAKSIFTPSSKSNSPSKPSTPAFLFKSSIPQLKSTPSKLPVKKLKQSTPARVIGEKHGHYGSPDLDGTSSKFRKLDTSLDPFDDAFANSTNLRKASSSTVVLVEHKPKIPRPSRLEEIRRRFQNKK